MSSNVDRPAGAGTQAEVTVKSIVAKLVMELLKSEAGKVFVLGLLLLLPGRYMIRFSLGMLSVIWFAISGAHLIGWLKLRNCTAKVVEYLGCVLYAMSLLVGIADEEEFIFRLNLFTSLCSFLLFISS